MKHVDDASTLPVTWWKSSASASQSDCVECGIVDGATVAVRDSKRPDGPALLVGRAALSAFTSAAALGHGRIGRAG
ncbi:uncharacterized protein DUF397 [Streptomyces sp. Ag109_O5-1]|uniref:DUF397 domain-containing protein n=1 Tax=Streptomyces TaxID=1883 RepID=UPI000F4DC798|nr:MULTISPECIES: DUF397 domain-containing protein [Streptomyces]RPE45154.1 uncharacterized protein DUF397 [Streptomyces sp. Ag109_O5-1]